MFNYADQEPVRIFGPEHYQVMGLHWNNPEVLPEFGLRAMRLLDDLRFDTDGSQHMTDKQLLKMDENTRGRAKWLKSEQRHRRLVRNAMAEDRLQDKELSTMANLEADPTSAHIYG